MRVERIPGVADIIHLDDPVPESAKVDIERIERGRARFGGVLLALGILAVIGASIWIWMSA